MRAIIIGDPISGKSTVAAELALLLAKIRKTDARPFAVKTQPTTAYRPYPIDTSEARTYNRMLSLLRSATGPVVIDDCSALYLRLLEIWGEQTSAQRERRGLPPKVWLAPDEWNAVNQRHGRLLAASAESGMDVIEIHRRGPVYVSDSDLGQVEGEGVKARGQSQSGTGGELVLLLDGGLRARRRESGSRVLSVLSDVSGRLNGRDLRLPQITSREDRDRLRRELAKFFRFALVDLVQWADAEAAAWKRTTEEAIPDVWTETLEASQRAESKVIAGQVKALLEIAGLGGQKADDKAARAGLLFESFEVGDIDSLTEVPAEVLREKLPAFRLALDHLRVTRSGGAA